VNERDADEDMQDSLSIVKHAKQEFVKKTTEENEESRNRESVRQKGLNFKWRRVICLFSDKNS
jgi:hypothetical protein